MADTSGGSRNRSPFPVPDFIRGARRLFDIPDDVSYLNCAYMSPQLRAATEAGQRAVAGKARPWEIGVEAFFEPGERYRSLAASLLSCDTGDIALVPSVSYGVSTAVANLRLGPSRGVLMLAEQFPSNVYPWLAAARRVDAPVVFVPRPDHGDWTRAVLETLASRDDLGLLALPVVHWTDGSRLEMNVLSGICRSEGFGLVLDVTQSLGAEPLDVRSLRPDFLVAAGYKWLLGPYGLGLMYADPDHHGGRPLEEAWMNRAASDDFGGLVNYRNEYQEGARRFDMGARAQFSALPAAIAALEQVSGWGVDSIAHTLGGLTGRIADMGRALGLETPAEGARCRHMIGLGLPPGAGPGVVAELANRHVYVSCRGDRLRVSPHVYNDENDVNALRSGLETTLASVAGPAGRERTQGPA